MHVLSLNSALEDASKCWHLADGSSLAVNSYPPSVSYQVISCVVRWSHGQVGLLSGTVKPWTSWSAEWHGKAMDKSVC